MLEYKLEHLMSFAQVTTGRHDANHAIETGKYRFYTCAYDYTFCDSYSFTGECLILPGNGANVGEVFYYNGKFDAYQRTYVIHNIQNVIPRYLYYYFKCNWKITGVAQQFGAATNYIKIGNFEDFKVKIYSQKLQHQIVEELDCLTSIIEKQKKQLEELDNLAQSIFYDMFGDPIENEKGWNILNLNQIGNFKNGLNFRKHEKGHSIKVLGVGDFKDNKEIRDFKHIETVEISDEISDDYLLKDEDIVFIRSNGSKDLVGRCIIVFPNKQEITFSGFCIRFRRTDDNYISLFLLYLFKNESFKRYYINRSNGCNINNISQTTLSIIPIPSPPLSLQQEFASKIEAIEKQKELIKKSIKETEDLFNSRMDYYFN